MNRRKSRLTVRADTSALGRRITDRMNELGLDDHDVSQMTELAHNTVRAIRRLPVVNPTAATLARLAKALKTTPNWLYGKDDKDDGVEIVDDAPPPRPTTVTVGQFAAKREELREMAATLNGTTIEKVKVSITIE